MYGSFGDAAWASRLWTAALATTLALVVPAIGYLSAAEAALPSEITAGEFTRFEIDGNVAGADDWDGAGYGSYETAQGRNSSGIVVLQDTPDACEQAGEDLYVGKIVGTAFPWPSATGNVDRKSDMCNASMALEVVDVDGELHYVLYAAVTRAARATGDVSTFAVLDLPGAAGDTLIEFDFSPSSGTAPVMRQWDGDSWEADTISVGFQSAAGPNPFVSSANPQTFVEFALDLTANDLFPPTPDGGDSCGTFSAAGFVTLGSNSFSSDLADRATFADPSSVTNCTDIEISKVSDPGNLASDDEFTYTLARGAGSAVHDDTLTASGGGVDSNGASDAITSTVGLDDTHVWSGVHAAADYVLDETALPDGWALQDIECTWYDPFTGGIVTEVVSDGEGDDTFAVPPPLVANGVTTSCVITNETSGVVVAKTGAGDPAAEFDFAVNGAPDTPYTLSLGDDTGPITLTPGTEVTISESLPVGDGPGWATVGVLCTDLDGDVVAESDTGTVTVTTVGADVLTCTYDNQQAGQVEVVKTGLPVGSGDTFGFDTNYDDNTIDPNGVADFSLEIDDPAVNSGDLAPGVYTVAELLDDVNLGPEPDYVLGDVTCELTTTGSGESTTTTSLDDANAVVTLAAGDVVTCTFTNVQAGRLTVVKETDGQDDTFAFTGAVSGSITTVDGATAAGDELEVDLRPGTHAVTEAIPAGWDLVDASCDDGSGTLDAGEDSGELGGIDLSAGEIVTCTFTNARETADLTLTKTWTDTAAQGDAVTLSAVGDDPETDGPATGTSTAPDDTTPAVLTVHPGETVDLAETFDAGNLASYDATLACDAAAGTLVDDGDGTGTLAVPTDDPADATCTFTNARRSAELTLAKAWVDGNPGDTATLAVDGALDGEVTSTAPDGAAVTVDVLSGDTVDLSEVLGDGNVGTYTTTLACTDDNGLAYTTGDLSGTYTVPATPTDVTCTFTNTRTSAQLTLRKAWVDGAAGDTADLAADATLATTPAGGATSTADGTIGTFLDTSDVVTVRVLSGETVTLSESLTGNLGSYDADLDCDVAFTDTTEPGADGTGTLVVADQPVDATCTFTNTRTRVDVTVDKAWVDAAADDIAMLFLTGSADADVDVTTAAGTPGTQTDADVVTIEALSGETITLDELLDPFSDAVYDTGIACDAGTVTPTSATGATVAIPSDATADITCTVTNAAARGTIVVVKNVVGANATFGFRGEWVDPDTAPGESNFTITTVDGTGSETFPGVLVPTDGSPYTLTETDPTPFYDGTSLVCDDPSNETTVAGMTASIDLDSGETVTCTYTNTERASLVVVNDAVPDDDQDFTFATTGAGLPATFVLDDDAGFADSPDPDTLSDTFTSELLPAGETYTVDELAVEGWTQQDVTCSDDSDPSVGITPEPGATVTCTFTNAAAPGSLAVTKVVTGLADDVDWSFDISVDPEGPDAPIVQEVAGTGDGSDTVTVAPLALNTTVTVAEPNLPAGWDQASFTCDVDDVDAATDGYQVTITEPGQAIACTVVNEARPAQLSLFKAVTGVADDVAWSFDFTLTPATAGESPTATATGTGSTTAVVGWGQLVPGETYTVSETTVAGYVAGELTCMGVVDTDADPSSVTFLAPLDTSVNGPEIVCGITNAAVPAVVAVTKTVSGVAATQDWSFDFTIDPVPGSQDATVAATGSGDGATTIGWTDLVPGQAYTISEGAVAGYDSGTLVCAGVDDTDGADDASVTFVAPLGGGEVDVDCAITNSARPSQAAVLKTVDGLPDDVDWSVDFTITPATPGEDATQTASGTGNATDTVDWLRLVPGTTYTITESAAPGYTAGTFACAGLDDLDDDPLSVTFVAPLDGSAEFPEVTCSITNTAQPASLVLDKSAVGGDGTFDFELVADADDATVVEVATVDGSGSATVEGLVPGVTYTVAEVDPGPTWIVGDLACERVRADAAGASVDPVAGFTVALGDVVTCAITNTATATIVVDKVTVPAGDPTVFDFRFGPLDGDTTDVGLSDEADPAVFGELAPGEYVVDEVVPDGWELSGVACSAAASTDGSRTTVTVAAGETVTCTYTNTQREISQEVVEPTPPPAPPAPQPAPQPLAAPAPVAPPPQQLPRTGVELPWLAMLAGLLLAAGLAVQELGRRGDHE